MCKSVSFDPNHLEFFKTKEMQDVIDNPFKAVEVFEFIEDPGQDHRFWEIDP